MSDKAAGAEAPPEPRVVPEEELSDALKALGQAIAEHPKRPEVAFCGIKLYVDAIGSGRVTLRDYLLDGTAPKHPPKEGELRIPMLAIAGKIVLSFDPTLAPEEFRLAP
jgi:hypothetical protein